MWINGIIFVLVAAARQSGVGNMEAQEAVDLGAHIYVSIPERLYADKCLRVD